MTIVKRWMLWWKDGYWKEKPLEPYDEFSEGEAREKAEKEAAARKKRKKKKGFDKPAGGQ